MFWPRTKKAIYRKGYLIISCGNSYAKNPPYTYMLSTIWLVYVIRIVYYIASFCRTYTSLNSLWKVLCFHQGESTPLFQKASLSYIYTISMGNITPTQTYYISLHCSLWEESIDIWSVVHWPITRRPNLNTFKLFLT